MCFTIFNRKRIVVGLRLDRGGHFGYRAMTGAEWRCKMHVRTWLSGICIAGFWTVATGLFLEAAESGSVRGSTSAETGDINVVNSQIMINGKLAGSADSGLVVGNGRRVTRTLPVAARFHGVDLSGLFKAEIVCGSNAVVEVLIDENLQPLMTATVRDGILSVRFTKPVQTQESPQLKIVLPTLDILRLSGGDTVRAVNVKGKRLQLIHEGSGSVTVAGHVEDFDCTVSGIGEVDAGKLLCRSAEVVLSGVGGVTCSPEAKLKANLSGIGNVSCLTHPTTVEKKATGLGDVEFVGK